MAHTINFISKLSEPLFYEMHSHGLHSTALNKRLNRSRLHGDYVGSTKDIYNRLPKDLKIELDNLVFAEDNPQPVKEPKPWVRNPFRGKEEGPDIKGSLHKLRDTLEDQLKFGPSESAQFRMLEEVEGLIRSL